MKKLISIVLIVGVILLGACAESLPEIPVTKDGTSVYYRTQPPYYGVSPDRQVNLKNNENARNPTWEELIDFLNTDNTDRGVYGFGLRVCSEFANELHDNAEKAGIKAAWVAIEFEDDSEGHAFNAFETTDRGLVFVDCTGQVPTDTISLTRIDTDGTAYIPESPPHADKISYVGIGKEYGLIYLEYALSPEYGFYEDYQKERDNINAWAEEHEQAVIEYNRKMDIYNSKVESYNNLFEEYELKVDGREVIEDPDEYKELSRMHNELNRMHSELEQEKTKLYKELIQIQQEREDIEKEFDRVGWYSIKPLGIISSVEIYW